MASWRINALCRWKRNADRTSLRLNLFRRPPPRRLRRLDLVDMTTMQDPITVTATEIAIPDGYHNRMDMSVNGQIFIGSYGCTNIGNVNNPERRSAWLPLHLQYHKRHGVCAPGQRRCRRPPGIQDSHRWSTSLRASTARLRHTKDASCSSTIYRPTGTINITGYIGDVKAIDFFCSQHLPAVRNRQHRKAVSRQAFLRAASSSPGSSTSHVRHSLPQLAR